MWLALFTAAAALLVTWGGRRPAALISVHQSECLPRPTGFIQLPHEISLQDTLDRLGYTVNVPAEVDGHRLFNWMQPAHQSDLSDAIHADVFASGGRSSFRELGVQSLFGRVSSLGIQGLNSKTQQDLWLSSPPGPWISSDVGQTADVSRDQIFTLHLACNVSHISSNANQNADSECHLLVLPALVGGLWIHDSSNFGHWSGGKWTGEFILCWDDGGMPRDYDYQDVVVLASGVLPISST